MTFQSSALLGFPAESSQAQLETGRVEARTLYRFHPLECLSPYDLVDWANERQLKISGVDSAWLRVLADRQAITELLSSRMDADQLERILDASAARGEWLVVEAEEY